MILPALGVRTWWKHTTSEMEKRRATFPNGKMPARQPAQSPKEYRSIIPEPEIEAADLSKYSRTYLESYFKNKIA